MSEEADRICGRELGQEGKSKAVVVLTHPEAGRLSFRMSQDEACLIWGTSRAWEITCPSLGIVSRLPDDIQLELLVTPTDVSAVGADASRGDGAGAEACQGDLHLWRQGDAVSERVTD